MNGILFHKLKGINGLSLIQIQTFDVSKIEHVFYKKRLFCLFDREHPYKLGIKYVEPISNTSHYITKRYMSFYDLKNDIDEIQIKQHKLYLLKQKFIEQMNNEYKNGLPLMSEHKSNWFNITTLKYIPRNSQ